ncbi:MAG: hypothetical protein ACYDB1_01220 [Acidiferrobacteraceae bacterium]
MARFTPQLPRPGLNTETAVRNVRTVSPQEAAQPAERLGSDIERAGETADKFLGMYAHSIQTTQYVKGSLGVKTTLDNAEAAVTSNLGDYGNAMTKYNAAKTQAALQIANSGYDPVVQKDLQQVLAQRYLAGSLRVKYFATKAAEADGKAAAGTLVRNLTTSAASSGVGTYAYDYAAQHIAGLTDKMVASGWYTPGQAKALEQQNLNTLDAQTVEAGIDGGHAAQTLSDLEAGKYKYLQGAAREKYMKAAQDAVHAQQIQNSAGVTNMADNMVANYETTGGVTGQEIAAFNATATPAQRAKYTPIFAAARTAYTTNQSLQQLPLAAQEAKVVKLQQTLKVPSNNQDAKIRLVNMVSREVGARIKAFHADPVSYAWSTPFGQQQSSLRGGQVNTQTRAGFLLQQKVVDAMYDQEQGIDPAKGQSPTPQQQAQRVYLSKTDLANLRTGYLGANPASAAEWLDSFDSHLPAAIRLNVEKQLFGPKGLPASALIYSSGMPVQDFADLKAVDNLTLPGLKDSIKAQTGGVLPAKAPGDISQYWNQAAPALGMGALTLPYRETFEKLTYYNIAKGMDSAQAAQDAFKTMFGNYTFKGHWMFPANTSTSTQAQIQAYGAQLIEKTPLYGYEGQDAAMRQEQAVLAKDNTWQYIPASNSYVLLDGDGVTSGSGNLVRGADGKPISFTYVMGATDRTATRKPSGNIDGEIIPAPGS